MAVADDDAPGLVNDNDGLNEWLPRFGRVIAEQVLEGVGDRLASRRRTIAQADSAANASATVGSQFRAVIAGQNLLLCDLQDCKNAGASLARPSAEPFPALQDGWPRGLGGGAFASGLAPSAGSGLPSMPASHAASGDSLWSAALRNSSFEAGSATQSDSYWGVWGRGAHSMLEGVSGDLLLDGSVTTGQLGADWSGSLLTLGLSLSHSLGEGDYHRGGDQGMLESTMTAITPYASLGTDRFSAWGAASAGQGEMTLTPQRGGSIETDLEMEMAAVGLRGQLLASSSGLGLAVLSDAMTVKLASEGDDGGLPGAEADVNRVRLAMEGSWTRPLAGGGLFSIRLEGGVRQDAGDAEEGTGGEVAGALSWTQGGVTFELEGRALATHDDIGFDQKGVSAYLAWDPRPDSGLGPSVSLRQHLGIGTASGLERLFAMQDMGRYGLEPGIQRLDAELAWGLPLRGSRFIGAPYLLHSQHPGGRIQTLGWLLRPLSGGHVDLSIDLRTTRQTDSTGKPGYGVALEGRLRF